MAKAQVGALDPVSNGGKATIEAGLPYKATARITGTAAMLFHRWNVEAVAEKANAKKGHGL